jgi:hypothetical protein
MHSLWLVACFGSIDRTQHGEAAGNQHKRHKNNVDNAGRFKRTRPVGRGHTKVTVGKENRAKCDCVRNDEQPHGELTRWYGVRRFFEKGAVPVDCDFRFAHSFSPKFDYSFMRHSTNR